MRMPPPSGIPRSSIFADTGELEKRLALVSPSSLVSQTELIERGLYSFELLNDHKIIHVSGRYLGAQILNHFLERNAVAREHYPPTVEYDALSNFLEASPQEIKSAVGILLCEGSPVLHKGKVRIGWVYDLYRCMIRSEKDERASDLHPRSAGKIHTADAASEERTEAGSVDHAVNGAATPAIEGIPSLSYRPLKKIPLLSKYEFVEMARVIKRNKEQILGAVQSLMQKLGTSEVTSILNANRFSQTAVDYVGQICADRARATTDQQDNADESEFDIKDVYPVLNEFYARAVEKKLLDPAEEDRLGVVVHKSPGILEAMLQRGCAANQGLVQTWKLRLAARLNDSSGLDMDDLEQEGNQGLRIALLKYDPDFRKEGDTRTTPYHFSTYASWGIRQKMNRAIADKGRTIRWPAHIHVGAAKIRQHEHKVWRESGERPSVAEIAEATGLSHEKVHLIRSGATISSLEEKVGDREKDGGTRLGDTVPANSPSPEYLAMEKDIQEKGKSRLDRIFRCLTAREELVIKIRFGIGEYEEAGPRTLDQVGEELALTRERVRQIEGRAIVKLRANYHSVK